MTQKEYKDIMNRIEKYGTQKYEQGQGSFTDSFSTIYDLAYELKKYVK